MISFMVVTSIINDTFVSTRLCYFYITKYMLRIQKCTNSYKNQIELNQYVAKNAYSVYITLDYMFISFIVDVKLPIAKGCVAVRKNLVLAVNPIAQNKIRT